MRNGTRFALILLTLGFLLTAGSILSYSRVQEPAIRQAAFSIAEIDEERRRQNRAFREFLKVPDMSAGLYVLGPEDEDRQSPHGEDEIYYVVAGEGVLQVDSKEIPVKTGSVVYVKANVPHRFHSIVEELKVLVVFAPAFGSSRQH